MTFAEMIAAAVRSADPNADAEHIARVVDGVSADDAWKDLTWLTPALASGVLQTQLNARAVAISNALKLAEQQNPAKAHAKSASPAAIAERFEMSIEQFRALPPAKRRELAEAAANAEREPRDSDVENLKAKQAAGKLSLTEKLTLARLENPGPTRAQRRDPKWIQSQQTHASVETLERLKRGHDQIWPSGNYPQVLRDHHKAESERLSALIAEKKAALETA